MNGILIDNSKRAQFLGFHIENSLTCLRHCKIFILYYLNKNDYFNTRAKNYLRIIYTVLNIAKNIARYFGTK